MEIKLRLPVRHVSINQPFGVNWANFYQKLGLKGHNGVDFKAFNGFDCYAAHDGEVNYADTDGTGGISVQITDKVNHFRTIYYHLEDFNVKVGQQVKAGDKIGHCDNTGAMTTGSHLHFGFKLLDKNNFNTLDYDNGYKGAIDPALFFHYAFDGTEIGPADYDKSNAYHRYYRGRPKGGLINEVKVMAQLTSKGIKPTAEKLNALVYGGWDLPSVQNESMREIWAFIKKIDYINGVKPFQN